MVSIKYEGVSTSLSQNQETKLQRLGGQRAHWFWITVTVLLSIFVLLLLRFNFCNRQSNTCFWTFRNATENLSQQNVEINCKQLSASLGVKALDYFVTQRKGEKCFLKDVEKLLGISIQRLSHIPQSLLDRFDLNADVGGLQKDGLFETYPTKSDNTSKKSAAHLVGTFSRSTRRISWKNIAVASGLYLSPELHEVKVENSGNYFLFGTINYVNKSFRASPFSIFQSSRYGVSKLENIQEQVLLDPTQKRETWSVQRIAYLNKDDSVYIHLSMITFPYVSTEPDVHIFGVFEI